MPALSKSLLVLCLTSCSYKVKGAPNVARAPEEVRAVPKPDQFQMGPGDRISIQVWRHDDLDLEVTIAPDGSITYPLVGRLVVDGMTYPQLVDTLSKAIAVHYVDPQVTVNIVELKNQKVFVVGEVANPSVLQLNNEMTVLEALTIAGGISPTSKTKNVLLIRGGLEKPALYTVDVAAIYGRGDLSQMVSLRRGDILVVPARTITDMARTFRDVQSMLSPFTSGSMIYRNALSGDAQVPSGGGGN